MIATRACCSAAACLSAMPVAKHLARVLQELLLTPLVSITTVAKPEPTKSGGEGGGFGEGAGGDSGGVGGGGVGGGGFPNALPLQISWDGEAPHLTVTSRDLFQVTSLDPMTNACAWFRCHAVSTTLVYLDSRTTAAAEPARPTPPADMQYLHIFFECKHRIASRESQLIVPWRP